MIHIGKGVSKLGANQDWKEKKKNAGDTQETNGYKSHIYTFIQETFTPTIQDTTSLRYCSMSSYRERSFCAKSRPIRADKQGFGNTYTTLILNFLHSETNSTLTFIIMNRLAAARRLNFRCHQRTFLRERQVETWQTVKATGLQRSTRKHDYHYRQPAGNRQRQQ